MIEINGIQLNVEMIGQGSPLVFVHGNGEDHHIFDCLVEKLKDHFRCYLIDSRGHGLSTKTNELHYHLMADDVLEVVKHYQLKKPSFLGFSDGGIIGLHLAMHYPKTFDRFMVLGANINTKGIVKNVRDAWAKMYETSKDPLFKLMIEEPNYKFSDLNRIKDEVMVVVGEHDVISKRHTKAIVKHIKHASLYVVKEKHHEDYIVNRDDLYPLCMRFFKKP